MQPARTFVDAAGREWTVSAMTPGDALRPHLPRTYADGWLSFDNPEERRHLVPVPAGWESATVDQLRGMLNNARAALPVGDLRSRIETKGRQG